MSTIYDKALVSGRMAIACPACGERARFDTLGAALPMNLLLADGTVERDSWRGHASCTRCGHNGTHHLDWPAEAWFRVEHRGGTLWARDEAMMAEIRRFIAAEADRKMLRRDSPFGLYLMRIPAAFLKAGEREALLGKIDRALAR